MGWLGGGMHNGTDLRAETFKQGLNFRGIADIQIMMLITGNVIFQAVPHPAGRGFLPKKLLAHIVIDADDLQSLFPPAIDKWPHRQDRRIR